MFLSALMIQAVAIPNMGTAIANGVALSQQKPTNPGAIANYWTNFGLTAGGIS